MGSTIVVGSAKAQCSKAKPAELGQSRSEQPKRGMRAIVSWRIRRDIEGTRHPQASYLSSDQDVSLMPLHVGWHRVVQVFR